MVIVGIFILGYVNFVGLAGVKRERMDRWLFPAFVMGIAMMLMLDTKFCEEDVRWSDVRWPMEFETIRREILD